MASFQSECMSHITPSQCYPYFYIIKCLHSPANIGFCNVKTTPCEPSVTSSSSFALSLLGWSTVLASPFTGKNNNHHSEIPVLM